MKCNVFFLVDKQILFDMSIDYNSTSRAIELWYTGSAAKMMKMLQFDRDTLLSNDEPNE